MPPPPAAPRTGAAGAADAALAAAGAAAGVVERAGADLSRAPRLKAQPEQGRPTQNTTRAGAPHSKHNPSGIPVSDSAAGSGIPPAARKPRSAAPATPPPSATNTAPTTSRRP